MAKEIEVRKITVDTSEAVESMDQFAESTEKVSESTEKLDKELGDIPGPLGKVQQGVQGLNKTFKALLANPIVLVLAAVVAVLGLLFKAFTKTQAGADKMKDVMAGLSAVVDVLTERAAKLLKALGQIFKGNFKEGFQEMSEAVKGVGDEIREATRAAIEYEKAVRAVFNAETDLITADAERRKQISQLRFDSRDLTKTINERREALEQAAAIEVEGLNETIALQEQRIALIQTEIANTPETLRTREQARQLAEAEVALLDLQTASLERQKGLRDELSALNAEDKAKRDAAIAAEVAAAAEVEKLRLDAEKVKSDQRKAEAEIDLQLSEELANDQLDIERRLAEETKAINDEVTANFIANTKAETLAAEIAERERIKIEQDVAAVKRQIYNDTLNALVGFLGEGSKVAKGLQIADATKSAIQGAIATYTSTSSIPIVGPVLAPIAAAAALAAGMANVRKMASVSGPLGGGGSVPSVSLAQPSTRIDSSNLVNADQSIPTDVQITQGSSQREPVETFVVESKVTAKQDIARQRQHDSTL